MARQERALRAKLRLQEAEGSGEDEEEEDKATQGALWGASKRAYYEKQEVCGASS